MVVARQQPVVVVVMASARLVVAWQQHLVARQLTARFPPSNVALVNDMFHKDQLTEEVS